MRGDGVFHRKVVEAKLACHRGHFLRRGPVQANPGHPTVVRKHVKGLLKGLGLHMAHAVHVDGIVDDGHGRRAPCEGIAAIRTFLR